ncbi:hypothetical protein APE01nite_17690 [Acetobacter peroxydans]|jgi:hypothetical protein|uniref:Uncharacterized protein n=1 Tax=Acetobacter peroxydans TaxID=104098 RepID=A0A4Y3TVU0_9PROT|nr:hypothetical protein AA13755_0599 [Acetobacter peroxydans NBRC 13755]GBR45234.1 hypothetical protein AA0475_2432 [Acetobacter peroxydans]GEB85972.1 hypothetical protein APE01nite_17690 [Acetobacter peroxydans]
MQRRIPPSGKVARRGKKDLRIGFGAGKRIFESEEHIHRQHNPVSDCRLSAPECGTMSIFQALLRGENRARITKQGQGQQAHQRRTESGA